MSEPLLPSQLLESAVNPLACQYALLRFRPFVETGEFANVGVVLLCPQGRFFGYRLLKKYARITQFFHQLDRKVYLHGKALFTQELERFALHLQHTALNDGTTNVPLALGLFAEFTRIRDSALQFAERRVVLARDPQAKLDELYDYYVERNFVNKAYQERLLESNIRHLLHQQSAHAGTPYRQDKVGAEDFAVSFPFVRKTGDVVDSVIKPLFLAHDNPTKVLTHGGQWVDKVCRLRRRSALPDNVLFPIAPPGVDSAAYAAYEEIRDDFKRARVQTVLATENEAILDFALA